MSFPSRTVPVFVAGSALCALTLFAVSDTPSAPDKKGSFRAPVVADRSEALNIPGAHNVFRVGSKLINGSQPEGEATFKALALLGVKTIITVDGAKPDIKSAQKYGMRYVQIPFGYDGLPRDTSLTMARAVRELPGLIYMHCHHGKHRSPVAAACVLMANKEWSREDALAFLKRAGTGANYSGLWSDVRHYQVPTAEEIKKAEPDFPPVAPTSSLVQTMVRMDELIEHLQATQKAAWKAPARHPDLEPAHEALMLREIYTELQRTEESKKRPQNFKNWLAEGEKQSMALEAALRSGHTQKADANFTSIVANCSACHAVYRNVPQKQED